jgi:hypothetical protein
LDWVCKRCVKNFQGKDNSATRSQSNSRHPADKTGPRSESSSIEQSETTNGMALSLMRYKMPGSTDNEAIEVRMHLAEEPSNGHPQAPVNSDLRQAARKSSNQHAPSDIERLGNSDKSAFQLNGTVSEARAVKEESMGGIFSTPAPNSSDLPPLQASSNQYWTIYHIDSPPHKRAETNLGESLNEAVNTRQSISFKPAAANGFRRDPGLKLRSSPSFDTSMHARHRMSQLDLDADQSEDYTKSISPEKSPEKAWSTFHAVTTTGRLQQPQEAALSTKEIQLSKPSLKRLTCYHWKQRGGCRYRDDECQYAHYETGMDEGKNTTCFWWWNTGRCKKSERDCLYAHRDTGLYAKPPPGYVPQKRKHIVATFPEHSDVFHRCTYGTSFAGKIYQV